MSVKEVFCLVAVWFLLSPITAFSQNGLKNILDKKVDEKIGQVKSKQLVADSSAVVVIDSAAIVAVAAAKEQKELAAFEPVVSDEIPFDTAEFKKRNLSVKSRTPAANYPNEDGWQKAFLITHVNSYKKKHTLDQNFKVFGWHPYWMGNAYKSYNFSLLSVISYFSYELNPSTGSYKSIHDWKTTSIVDSAHKHGTKVVLSVTNFGVANNAAFLSNKNAQKTFINTLITLLRERNADGVNIDFEAISARNRSDLTNFIIDLSSSLRSSNKDYLITIALPAVDFDNVYEMKQLNQYVDLFVIMGYEFYGANSKVAGPVAPLMSGQTWWPYNLERAVKEYLISGVSSEKLLLGLPYYGAEWQTTDLKFPSKVQKFIGYSMYRNIKDEHGDIACCQDEVSGSRYYVYRDDRNNYRQIWYEDQISLGKKYDWVKDKKIGGVGIWALGYDNGHTELWEALATKFSLPEDSVKVASAGKDVRSSKFSWRYLMSYVLRIGRNPESLLTNPRPLMMMFGTLFGVSMISVFILIRYGYKFKRIYKILFQGGISLLAVALLAIIFLTLKYAGIREVGFLLGGFIVAGLLFFFLTRQFLLEKDLP